MLEIRLLAYVLAHPAQRCDHEREARVSVSATLQDTQYSHERDARDRAKITVCLF